VKKLYYFIIPAFLLFASCQSDDDVTSKVVIENFVTAQEAGQIAKAQIQKSDLTRKSTSNSQTIYAVKDDLEDPTMYIINNKIGGFVIVSADNRTEPILAFSETNNFSTDLKKMPDGVSFWMKNQSEYIREVRKGHSKQTLVMQKVWNKYKNSAVQLLSKKSSNNQEKQVFGKGRVPSYLDWTSEGDCNQGDNSTILIHRVAPLTSITWGQGNGYNDLLEFNNCTNSSNGKYLTGCVATAVAEVMKYHEFPSSYNWNSMPLSSGSAETSRLMRDLGVSGNLNVDYGCDASSADRDLISRTFRNLGYPMPNFSNYNYTVVRNEIAFGRPVILCGGTEAAFLIFGQKSGHCWVADGLNEVWFYECVPDPNTPGEQESVLISQSNYIHMNWGWEGSYNGWYSAGNFNPADRTYNWRPSMITNIKPQ
jgi:hypothetical protein